MRAGARTSWRLATVAAFGATAVLAVTLSARVPGGTALQSSSAQAPVAQCALSGLRISIGPGALAGQVTRYAVQFTNVSRASCTLAGYPQVTPYRGDHVRVGATASADMSVAASRVLLTPGQTAHASLDAAIATARCRPVQAAGLSVNVTAGSGPRYVRRPLRVCAGLRAGDRNFLRVRAIQAGSGVT
jgi:Protein of unknown function (DUF4232)